jgi:hypothetical protein
MIRTIIGVVVASVVIYGWGFLYWGMGPYPRLIWKQVTDDDAAARALAEQFPQRGTYFVPDTDPDQQKTIDRMEKGPVALVHMLAPQGRPAFDSSIMGQGFVLNLVVVVLVAVLLYQLGPAAGTYWDRLKLVTLIGITASLLIDGGDVVWWQIPWQWKLYQAVYNVSVWIIAGAILGALMRPGTKAQSG